MNVIKNKIDFSYRTKFLYPKIKSLLKTNTLPPDKLTLLDTEEYLLWDIMLELGERHLGYNLDGVFYQNGLLHTLLKAHAVESMPVLANRLDLTPRTTERLLNKIYHAHASQDKFYISVGVGLWLLKLIDNDDKFYVNKILDLWRINPYARKINKYKLVWEE